LAFQCDPYVFFSLFYVEKNTPAITVCKIDMY